MLRPDTSLTTALVGASLSVYVCLFAVNFKLNEWIRIFKFESNSEELIPEYRVNVKKAGDSIKLKHAWQLNCLVYCKLYLNYGL